MKRIIIILILILLIPTNLNANGMDFDSDDGNIKISLPILVKYSRNIATKAKALNKVEIKEKNESYSDEYVEVTVYKPVIAINNNHYSEELINLKINNIINEFQNKIQEESKRDNLYNIENGFPLKQYIVNVNYTIHLNKDNILSLTLSLYSYTGGAHGSSKDISLNIDTNTGKNGVIKDFLGNNDYDEIILREIKAIVKKNPDMYFEDEINKLNKLPYNQKFYLTDDSIVVYFDEYEIAPYVAGSPKFSIPLDKFPEGLNKINIKEEVPIISTEYIYNKENEVNKCLFLPYISNYSEDNKYKAINTALKENILKMIYKIEMGVNNGDNIVLKGITSYFSTFFNDENEIKILITCIGNNKNSEIINSITNEYVIDLKHSIVKLVNSY